MKRAWLGQRQRQRLAESVQCTLTQVSSLLAGETIRSLPPGQWEVSSATKPDFYLSSSLSLLHSPLPPSAMTNDPLDPHDNDHRPHKRPRPAIQMNNDLGVRPYTIPTPGPSVHQSESDGNPDGQPKKGRKRPLSCGECRR